jgi:hypothetical protein
MNVAIFGCGKMGKYLAHQIFENDNIQVSCFVDNNLKKTNNIVLKKQVISFSALKNRYLRDIDAVLIGVKDVVSVNTILVQLRKNKIYNIGVVRGPVSFEKKLDLSNIYWESKSTKPILSYLETNIIDNCNLQCSGCTHFANLFLQNSEGELNSFKKDLRQIANHVEVLQFRLLGGEPLLSKRLTEYITVAREFMPKTDIRLVSNGILFPQQKDELFQSLIDNDIHVDITLYPPTKKLQAEISRVLECHGITYGFSTEVNTFYRTLNLAGESDFEKSFNKCLQKHCNFFRNGRLYICPYEALLIEYVKYFKLEKEFLDVSNLGVDMHNTLLNWHEIVSKLNNPIELCKHCSDKGGELFSWSVSNNPKKEEWLVHKVTECEDIVK